MSVLEPFLMAGDTYSENLIYFYCFSTDIQIDFPCFLTSFSDQYTPSWTSQELYSRMDPIPAYKSTKRKINFSFDVPSESIENAKLNYRNINILMDSMYPLFSSDLGKGTNIVKGSPLFKIKMANYINSYSGGLYNMENKPAETVDGVIGIIQNISLKPELESGFFIDKEKQEIYPKLFKINVNFDVISESDIQITEVS